MITPPHRGDKTPAAPRPTRSAGRGAAADATERGAGHPATRAVPDGSIAALESRLGC
ncbi:hypothetical protein [Ancylobacter lacus]|uniref:hypothetical protein n=1 Tax=Ancylobacter lacus TaxID=2579970 RepID=UPI001BD0D7A9|nr:hypothetical protein [Ancylobacter lacus]MBS7538290.1 hypothetical protein [Ancylobacter lacus]